MISRDFLLRQIQQLAQVTAQVMRLRSDQQHHEALQEIEQALLSIPGLDGLLQTDLTQKQVLNTCRVDGEFSAEKAVPVADILAEKAYLHYEDNLYKAYLQYALWLYEEAISTEGASIPLDMHERIAHLRAALEAD